MGILIALTEAANAVGQGEMLVRIPEPWVEPFFSGCTWFNGGTSAPFVFCQGTGHINLRETTRQQKPAVVGHHLHVSPACSEKRHNPVPDFIQENANVLGQFPASIMAFMVDVAEFAQALP